MQLNDRLQYIAHGGRNRRAQAPLVSANPTPWVLDYASTSDALSSPSKWMPRPGAEEPSGTPLMANDETPAPLSYRPRFPVSVQPRYNYASDNCSGLRKLGVVIEWNLTGSIDLMLPKLLGHTSR